jgi:hypothetical protein
MNGFNNMTSSFVFPLTPTEKQFIDGSTQFTNAQKRYNRCRLNKKLQQFNLELTVSQQRCSNIALKERDSCNGSENGLGLA